MTATTIVNAGIAQGKSALCTAMTNYEACFVNSTAGCDTPTMQTYQAKLMATRQNMTGTLGVDCLSVTPAPVVLLASGDSGSPSGSATIASSSGSGYGLLTWQLILLVLFCLCCVCGGGGGGYYALNHKKLDAKGKGVGAKQSRDMERSLPEAEPQYEYYPAAPMTSVIVDTSGDERRSDIVDDGIPEALEQPVVYNPVREYPVDAQGNSIEPSFAQSHFAVAAPAEVEPLLFGPVGNLFPGLTGSTVTMAAPGAYETVGAYSAAPTYGAYGAYGGSSYVSGSTYHHNAVAAQAASNYYTTSANPTYATTSYAAPGALLAQAP